MKRERLEKPKTVATTQIKYIWLQEKDNTNQIAQITIQSHEIKMKIIIERLQNHQKYGGKQNEIPDETGDSAIRLARPFHKTSWQKIETTTSDRTYSLQLPLAKHEKIFRPQKKIIKKTQEEAGFPKCQKT